MREDILALLLILGEILNILCSKLFKLAFSCMWTENFQMYKLGFKEVEESEIKLPTFIGSWKKQENSRKTFTYASLIMLKPLWTTTNWKILKRWEYHTTLPVSWETCMQVKKQVRTEHETSDWFKTGKGVLQGCYCHSAYLIYMHSTSYKMWAGWITSWNQDCWEKYQYPQICR